ncbi:DNA-directed RNA polymerase subunit beta' [bacterium]|nr:DNA-directed RNA polymerase subunit beta' [candidate division CSSED10-310 bacterium]
MEDIYNLFEKPRDAVKWDAIRIKLASPEKIREWSHGEVTKPETINYRTFKPERGGLFCAKIFGPIKDFECNCGKYKRMKHRGVICDKCGVEVIQSKVRRERLGHIELACPVSHVWFFKGLPSRIGNILNMSLRELERILYFELYVVIDSGDTPLKVKELLDEERFQELREEYGTRFRAGMGAEAIRELLARIDPAELSAELRLQMQNEKVSIQARKKIVKRLKVVEALKISGNRPEWMIMEVIPVLPPELRPLVPLDGGRFATSDLNDLYRRVINRNNRLKRLQELKAPDVIVRNEKRMLQEAVDALFDNGRRGRALKGPNNRPLRSLSDMLKGKQGRFRQNLLGKRVDYSGRSVIVVGPELQLTQCGLPKKMALELFKPFIFNKLEEKGLVTTIKNAKKMVEMEVPEVWEILEEVIKDHPVLLNRAPTLHRLGIQAFQPLLVEGKAIRIHPLVCTAFNADFDGDQMAVHVPLSLESQLEARLLMMSNNNILSPANGSPIAVPTQDIVLGCYYLTRIREGEKGEGKIFSSGSEVLMAFDSGQVGLQARIWVRVDGQLIQTTVGRVLFNEALPESFPFYNRIADKSELGRIISQVYRDFGKAECVETLDAVKDLGFRFASWAGISININDLYIPENKKKLIENARMEVIEVEKQYQDGIITDGERYNKVVDIWTHVTERVADELFRSLEIERMKDDRVIRESGPFNPVYMMSDSGARGSKMQIRQLAGMRGLMAKPSGEIIETPITANFREGLTVLQYFISTHGARKGLADTALKTADSGYLTRRLVDVAQDVIITEDNCGTDDGITVTSIVEGGEIIEPLYDRILGRVSVYDVKDPFTGQVLCGAQEMIDEIRATRIVNAGVEQVSIRSALTCECRFGICRRCYGWDLSQARPVDLGEAVGVIAAQSIGEPGTQLTMRTFHIGGTAKAIEEEVTAETEISGRVIISSSMKLATNSHGVVVVLSRKEGRIIIAQPHIRSEFGGKLRIVDDRKGEEPGVRLKITGKGKKTESYFIRSDDLYDDKIKEFEGKLQILREDGADIEAGEIVVEKMRQQWTVPEKIPYGAKLKVTEGQITQPAISAKVNGLVRFYHLEGDQLRETDKVLKQVEGGYNVMDRACFMKFFVDEEDTQEVETYYIARGAKVLVKPGDRVKRDQLIVESTMPEGPDRSTFLLAEWDPFATPLMAEESGEVILNDVIEEVTLNEELDVVTGQSRKVIGVYREELKCPETKCKFREIKRREGKKQYCPIHQVELQPLHPSFSIKGTKIRVALPTGAHLFVDGRQKIKAGDVVALILRESQKTKDITGGLPRVVELFEARKPRENAVIAEIDGQITYGPIEKGMQKIIITGSSGAQTDYDIPRGTHINVQENDYVRAGEPLMGGSSNPHDILRVLGEKELQRYLVNEVQAVYRLQGVVINDKHIEVIIRQMLKMIRIDDVGDTSFLYGEQVDRWRFNEENDRAVREGGKPATGSLLLQGITKASLSTESFISAASFQETTRVLTEAAVSGKIDYLRGLKENVVVGRLIPAGTGFPGYQNVAVVARFDHDRQEPRDSIGTASSENNVRTDVEKETLSGEIS